MDKVLGSRTVTNTKPTLREAGYFSFMDAYANKQTQTYTPIYAVTAEREHWRRWDPI